MAYHTIAGQLVPGDDTTYVALSNPDIDAFTFQTLEEAEAKLAEVVASEVGIRKYRIFSYD